jgi:hypothetical protein
MKRSYLFLAKIVIFSFIISLSSCLDNDLNISPNAINEKNLKTKDGVFALVVATQVAAGDFYAGDRSRLSSIWTWQMCAPAGLGRPQPNSWNGYLQQEDGPANEMWIVGYNVVRLSNDLLGIKESDVQLGANNAGLMNTVHGMAKFYKALAFGELSTYFGPIPINISGIEAPQFVSINDAYNEVQKLLDEAIVHFGNSAPLSRDLNFKGDGAKWIAACHSLKARYYLNIKNYTSAQSEATLGITDAANNLKGIYSKTAGEFSPWGHWSNDEAGEPIRVDATYMRLLKSEANDGRIAKYFSPNGSDGGYWGFAQRTVETPDTNETNATSAASMKIYKSYDTPFPIVTAEENSLILAEVAARNGDETTALTNVNNIRKAAGLSDFSGSGAALIAEILKQKYLELFLQGLSYADMRRTGTFPDSDIPIKWIYPISENLTNPNVPKGNAADLMKELLP